MKLPYHVDLKGKTVAITGGSGVLGSAMSEALAACGASVAVLGRNVEKSEAVVRRIESAGGRAMAVACDVLDRRALENARDSVGRAFGQVDILINGAGGNMPQGTTSMEQLESSMLQPSRGVSSFFDLAPAAIKEVMDLNFTGALMSSQVFGREMAARGSGQIINISSMSGIRPLTKVPAYSAAKAALTNFTQWLAVHLAKCGIRVNAIAPGFFLTEQNRHLLQNSDGTLTARARTIVTHTPMGRFGRPEDLIGALLWLACDEASGFVTGAVIPVDGGFSAFGGV